MEVADDRVASALHDRCLDILVDGQDGLGCLAADDVLDGAADAAGDVEVGRDAQARLADLFSVCQRYTQALFTQVAQTAACNRLHDMTERCARWLLQTHDRVKQDEFDLTHEFLAQMLGVRRATVTVAVGALQQAGLITYRRGEMRILDRVGLEEAACPCYRIVTDEYERLLPSR